MMYSRMLLLFIIFSFSVVHAQTGYTLHGKITGLKENEKVTMSLVVGYDFRFENRDSAYVKNGEFFIKGTVPNGPRTYWLNFDKHIHQSVPLFIDNEEQIEIACPQDISQIPHSYIGHYMDINGSRSNYAKNVIAPAITQYGQARGILYNYLQKLKDSIGFDPRIVGLCLTLIRRGQIRFISHCFMNLSLITCLP